MGDPEDRHARRRWTATISVATRAVLLGAGVLLLTAAAAGAHALRVASSPDAGAVVSTAPTQVTVTFGEEPDARLSSLRVLDTGGHNDAKGPTTVVPAHPLTLAVAVAPLARGVYTVAWTTVSRVDGHLATGAFAFGVGVSPSRATARATVGSAGPSDGSTAARWLFYVGMMVLTGGAVTSLVCFRRPVPHWKGIAAASLVVAMAGAIGLALTGASSAHVGIGGLLSSTFGDELKRRSGPLLLGAAVVLVPLPRRWVRGPRVALLLSAATGLGAMWGDVLSSHAAASSHDRLARMAVQWFHFAAAGIWLGGLLVVLLASAALTGEERSGVLRRFSRLALGAVVVLAASGLQRALDEVGGWHALRVSAFGHYVIVKTAVFAALVGLGAVNRYRSVPAVARVLRPLRAIGTAEVGLGAVVLVATALLQGLAPPASVAAAVPKPLVVSGSDFATTVKARLFVLPGEPGFNSFELQVTDYDTGRPLDAAVSLTFRLPARPDLGASILTLARGPDGTYRGQGANLAVQGTWAVTALIQSAANAVTVMFSATLRQPPEQISVVHNRGLPAVYTISLSGGRGLQIYLDPGHRGFNEFHATYIGTDGNELAMRSLGVTVVRPNGRTDEALAVRKLDTIGHYVADLPGAVAGRYLFSLAATAADGTSFNSTITVPDQ